MRPENAKTRNENAKKRNDIAKKKMIMPKMEMIMQTMKMIMQKRSIFHETTKKHMVLHTFDNAKKKNDNAKKEVAAKYCFPNEFGKRCVYAYLRIRHWCPQMGAPPHQHKPNYLDCILTLSNVFPK